MKTDELCIVRNVDITANFSFRPRTSDYGFSITGLRSLQLSQDDDASWIVTVRDAGDTDWETDRDHLEKTHDIVVRDPAGVRLLNAIVDLLASPFDQPLHRTIGSSTDETNQTADAAE